MMLFGLCNAPSTFERLMDAVLEGLLSERCLVYLATSLPMDIPSNSVWRDWPDCYEGWGRPGCR